MKKKAIYIVIYSLLLTLMVAAEVNLVHRVLLLNMLPDLYVAALIGIFAILSVGIALLLFLHRKDKWIGVARQIIACILIAVTVAGCFFISPKIHKLQSTVQQITTNEEIGPTRNIYVMKADPAKTIQEAADYTFAALRQDEYCTEQVVEALEAELGETIMVEYYDDESLMIVAYYNKEANALIFNEGFLSIWGENELYTDFNEKNRVLHSVQVTEKQDANITEPEPEIPHVPDVTNTPFIVYISGMDGESEVLKNTRSDTNILMVVNPATKQILLVNTPRDYYIVHPWGNGGKDKLTHCGVYGIQCSIDAMENLYGVSVDYYFRINFKGLETLVDAIDGITVYSEKAFMACHLSPIVAGENHLDGEAALRFARDRYNQPGGDNGRGKNQMKVIKAVIAKVTSGRTLIANYSAILNSLEGMLATSVPAEDINKLVKMQLSDMAQWNILSYAVTGYGGTQTTYSMPGLASYVMHPHQYTVDYGKELIQRVIDGEILTQDDMTVPK